MRKRTTRFLVGGFVLALAGAGELRGGFHGRSRRIASEPPFAIVAPERKTPGMPPPKAVPVAARATAPVVVPMAVPPKLVSEWVREIAGGTEPPAPFRIRLARAGGLGTALPDPERETLLDYLAQPSDPALSPEESAALRNEIANRLRVQRPPVVDLDRAFMDMADDPRQDPVWRDYCIQHLGTMLGTMDPAVAHDFFRRFVLSGANVAAGTALLAMSREPQLFPAAEVADKAASFLSDPLAPESVRVTALQVLADVDLGRALPFARDALSAPAPQHVRLSALAVVSRSSAPEDRETLLRFSRSSNALLRKAAHEHLLPVENP